MLNGPFSTVAKEVWFQLLRMRFLRFIRDGIHRYTLTGKETNLGKVQRLIGVGFACLMLGKSKKHIIPNDGLMA